ncbi:MAG: hydrogenase 4 subunit F [Desulfovibrio sp.]|jgi:hydrogenase-4 component F|nr:hydrogenase 4 subunit F [Desulfovibrio sp.]
MSNTFLIYLVLVVPLCTSLVEFALGRANDSDTRRATKVNVIGISVLLLAALKLVAQIYDDGAVVAAGNWLLLDSLGAIFLGVTAVLAFLTGLYSVGYMRNEVGHGEISINTLCNYYGFFHLFIFTMLLSITTNNLILMWAAIESTTLASTFLVGIYRQRSSLEAAWKYVIICTVGVAFGLYGTILIFSNASVVMPNPEDAIFCSEVLKYSDKLDPSLVRLAFVFIVIGFGTKMGLFPMHAWLPDAHSEAPSPTSALLSAVLLKCAFLVILRYYIVIQGTIGVTFMQNIFLLLGFLSIFVAALFIVIQHDIKRKLAYHSVQNMGLIAVGIGFGGPIGALAALMHVINHSLAKGLLFCVSGNILLKYGTRDMHVVRGMLKVMPVTALFLTCGALGLGGMPPFNVFVSEFLVVMAGINSHNILLTVLLLAILVLVLSALVNLVSTTIFGQAPPQVDKGELGWLTLAPTGVLLILMLMMGTYIPKPVTNMLTAASRIVMRDASASVAARDVPEIVLKWTEDAQKSVKISALDTARQEK